MSDSRSWLTNNYLKAGIVLLSVAILVFLMGFVRGDVPSAALRGPVAVVLAVAGAALFIVGLIVKIRRA